MSGVIVKQSINEVRVRVGTCILLVMLSVDSFNPVKVICGVLSLGTEWVAILSLLLGLVIIYANGKEVAYFSTKIFFHSILSIFFSSIEILSKENIPEHGPIIFTGNHMNQFVDGAMMLVTNPHQVRFLVAESSYKQRVIGDFAKAIGSIPVVRPQDSAKKAKGKIKFEGLTMYGMDGTEFTKIKKSDKIRPGRMPDFFKIKEVISDTEAILLEERGELSPLQATQIQGLWAEYEVLEFVDQSHVFNAAHESLAKGNCLGIFPEGGSHDNSDLLPLKVGIAAIAFGVLEKYNKNVQIVPVGLNYFRGHKFRGRVVVEFGKPIQIDKNLAQLYKVSKRDAYQELLEVVEDGMRAVLVTAKDYDDLRLIHTIRRLYQRGTSSVTTSQKQDLARRFSVSIQLLKEKYKDGMPQDLLDCKKRLEDYENTLDTWGLKDYQISNLESVSYSKLLYKFVYGFSIMMLASIPSLILNAPVGYAAKIWAHSEAEKDLKKSRVKINARDVLLSKKITFCIVGVPMLWMTYAILLYVFSSLETMTIIVFFLCCPLFSYLGVMAVEASIVSMKDLKPAFLRLMPSFREETKHLPGLRLQLQKEVRAMAKKYGPDLGPVYSEKSTSWEKSVKKSLLFLQSSEDLFTMGQNNMNDSNSRNNSNDTKKEL